VSQASRDWQAEFAAGRLLPLVLMQAQSDLMQFRFAHDAGQAEQQAIVIGTGQTALAQSHHLPPTLLLRAAGSLRMST
jgi:hypothetical protein